VDVFQWFMQMIHLLRLSEQVINPEEMKLNISSYNLLLTITPCSHQHMAAGLSTVNHVGDTVWCTLE
jgi:hypothetical protein